MWILNNFKDLTDLFLWSYEADCIQQLLKGNKRNLAQFVIFTFRFIGYVLSLNNLNLVIW